MLRTGGLDIVRMIDIDLAVEDSATRRDRPADSPGPPSMEDKSLEPPRVTGMNECSMPSRPWFKAADPVKRRSARQISIAYATTSPTSFFWATGAQSPALINPHAVAHRCSLPGRRSSPRPRAPIRMVGRKPKGKRLRPA